MYYAANDKVSFSCPFSGGAGGKGTWGAPGDELFAEGGCRDANDPNYDSDTQVRCSYQG